jgi:hypothetical protein
MNSSLSNCLLISPKSFYSFSHYIKDELISLGYTVTLINEEFPEGMSGKILARLSQPLLSIITDRIITKRYLNGKTYDLVLIIKGRGMSKKMLRRLLQKSKKVIGYNFDSFDYNKASLKWYRYATRFFTFDYRDAERYCLPVVELFSSISKKNNTKTTQYTVSAILRNHSDRLNYVHHVLNTLRIKNHFIFIFEKNIFTFVFNFLRNPFLYLKYKKYISFKPLSYNDYIDVLQKSNFTIDYAHPKQSGITIRCFEALSTGTKIITNNSYVNRNGNFNESNTVIYNKDGDKEVFKKQFQNILKTKINIYNRTIKNFLMELLS